MGKIIALVVLLLPQILSTQFDSFDRKPELSGHIILKNKDTLIPYYFGKENLAAQINHSANTYVNAGHLSGFFLLQILDSLEANKVLSKNQKISQYIKTLPQNDLTVKDLVEHRTNFPKRIWKVYRDEEIRGNKKLCSPNILDNECAFELLTNLTELNLHRSEKSSFSEFNTILLVKILEVAALKDITELIKTGTRAIHKFDIHHSVSEGQLIDFSGKIHTINSSLDMGLPFDDRLLGLKGLYAKSMEIVKMYQEGLFPKLSGDFVHYTEVYETNGFQVFLFLNRTSEKENFISDLKSHIAQNLLPKTLDGN